MRAFTSTTTCHVTGVYRGAAHSAYNLMCRLSESRWKLPVVIHNLNGYDGHLIVKALKSEVIPQTMEKHLSLLVGKLKFIDFGQSRLVKAL